MKKEENFVRIIELHRGIIYKIAHSYCKNEEDRKDLVQEIVIQLWRSIDTYNGVYQYSTWIYRIALNVAISFYRKENKRTLGLAPFTESILYLPEAPNTGEKEETLRLLQQYISELKEFDKALTLLYLEEKSYKEMAEIMGISETNVATKISRIKKKLGEYFLQQKTIL
jgi:RNA polymerase sigma factor (sigma-70 family)